MEQTVYADLLFLINFSMDFLCLFLAARLLARPFSPLRVSVAAVLGGVYSVCALFLPLGGWSSLADLLVCGLLCLLALSHKTDRAFSLLLTIATFVLISMLLGGIMTAVFNLMNRASPPLDTLADNRDVPLWLFALGALLSGFVTWFGGKFLRRRSQIAEAEVEIRLGGRSTVIRAMCDSGNLLRDAVSGRPVIVSDPVNAARILPPECRPVSEWSLEALSSLPPEISARIRLIPISSVGAESVMLALRPDSISVRVGNRVRTADALVGFAPIRGAIHTCSAIIPPELLT